jgi:hypothetical protein
MVDVKSKVSTPLTTCELEIVTVLPSPLCGPSANGSTLISNS